MLSLLLLLYKNYEEYYPAEFISLASTCMAITIGLIHYASYIPSTSWIVSGSLLFLVSGSKRANAPAPMATAPKTIVGYVLFSLPYGHTINYSEIVVIIPRNLYGPHLTYHEVHNERCRDGTYTSNHGRRAQAVGSQQGRKNFRGIEIYKSICRTDD